MPEYLVSYDLRKVRDYRAIIEKLSELKGAWKPVESVWIIPQFSTASALRAYLDPALDADDGLIVVELGPDQSFRNPDGRRSVGLEQYFGIPHTLVPTKGSISPEMRSAVLNALFQSRLRPPGTF